MGRVRDYIPALKYGHKLYPEDLVDAGGLPLSSGKVIFVDGDAAGDGSGTTWVDAFNDIQAAENASSAGDAILIAERTNAATDTDPISYAETVIVNTPNLSLIGVSRGRTQGGLPQIRKGSGSTALLTIQAPGCLIANLGFNGTSATGGGILLDDDGGSTKAAFGTTIANCHFKNCVGSTATSAATGGAIQWAATGGAWQVLIKGNNFYKNVGDVVLKGTTGSVPQDVVIEDNIFSGPAANVDCNLYLAGGSGMNGVYVINNIFPAFPALTSGANLYYASMGGCVGILAHNYFGTDKTFGAAGTGALIPTTVFLSGNYDEGGLIARV